jgi:hypothetical protein
LLPRSGVSRGFGWKATIGDQGMEESAAAAVSVSADWMLVSANNVNKVPTRGALSPTQWFKAISLVIRSPTRPQGSRPRDPRFRQRGAAASAAAVREAEQAKSPIQPRSTGVSGRVGQAAVFVAVGREVATVSASPERIEPLRSERNGRLQSHGPSEPGRTHVGDLRLPPKALDFVFHKLVRVRMSHDSGLVSRDAHGDCFERS